MGCPALLPYVAEHVVQTDNAQRIAACIAHREIAPGNLHHVRRKRAHLPSLCGAPVRRVRSVESIIGYLHSTSFASVTVLGGAVAAFDDRVRERRALLVDSDGFLHDDNEFDILTAAVPR